MLTTLRPTRQGSAVLWRFATALALLAQCWIAVAAFGDARGFGASAHVEASGTNLHYAHNEADCAACRTLALSALPLSGSVLLGEVSTIRETIVAVIPHAPRLPRLRDTRTRAPPSLV